MAPSYFGGVRILKDKSLNVAYWNLHERTLRRRDGIYTVDDQPLSFFHFSGFNPRTPERLSKHQSRHRANDSGALAGLMVDYAERLIDRGHLALCDTPVFFSALRNGVRLNHLTQWVVRQALELKLDFPGPEADPDGFCRFLATPNYAFDRRGIAPLLVALERGRPDVKAAFAPAFESAEHAHMILSWFASSGAAEEGVETLIEKFGSLLSRLDICQRAVECWRARVDLQRAFPEAFSSLAGATAFAVWIDEYGVRESGFESGEGAIFLERRHGLIRPLMLFLQDLNLQREFRFPFLDADRTRYVKWLYLEAVPRRIVHHEDVAWFEGFAICWPEKLAAIVLGHGAWLHADLVGGGTLFDVRQISDMLSEYRKMPSPEFLSELYLDRCGLGVMAQAEQFFHYNEALRDRHPDAFRTGQRSDAVIPALLAAMTSNIRSADGVAGFRDEQSAVRSAGKLRGLLRGMRKAIGPGQGAGASAASGDPQRGAERGDIESMLQSGFARIREAALAPSAVGVNLAGYLMAPTGMGESARSMARTLDAAEVRTRNIPLFSPQYRLGDGEIQLELERSFASYCPENRVNILVANGDDYQHLRGRLPYAFFAGRRNVGYWVWETERLPAAHSDTEGLAEIWTPSAYSARAIQGSVKVPVHVLPHVMDLDEIDRVAADRVRFGLPPQGLICGYFFDCKSVLERKNPHAAIAAFRAAFGTDHGPAAPTLLLKASSPQASPREFAELRKLADGLRVVWITEELSRADSLALMKSVDIYMSLHRSEGFGLTLAEAMAMGKSVVASAYSGNLDFMTPQNSRLVSTPVIVTDRTYGAYAAGTVWGNPSVDDAATQLDALRNADIRAELGMRARASVREQLGAKRVGVRLIELLQRLS